MYAYVLILPGINKRIIEIKSKLLNLFRYFMNNVSYCNYNHTAHTMFYLLLHNNNNILFNVNIGGLLLQMFHLLFLKL